LFNFAETNGLTTYQAALAMAEKRIADKKKEIAK